MQIIEKGNGLFDVVKWVISARSDDETRYFMNGLYVEAPDTEHPGKWRLVATDGRRMHVAEIRDIIETGLEAGNWKIASESGKQIIIGDAIEGQFPNYVKVWPSKSDRILKTYEPFSAPKMDYKVRIGNLSRALVLESRSTGRIMNAEYFLALSEGEWKVSGEDNADKAIEYSEIGSDDLAIRRYAIIMPMSSE